MSVAELGVHEKEFRVEGEFSLGFPSLEVRNHKLQPLIERSITVDQGSSILSTKGWRYR